MGELRIPGYSVWGLLGEGGMSEVWLAKHDTLLAPVIVKTLRRALRERDEDAASARILHEARLMARVPSPRIVRVLDAGGVDGNPYLVQEYVDGLDFSELDRRRRTSLGVGLPLWLVCHVMRDVCFALRDAHRGGVVHRDLKPSNVFGAPETGIRLGDFGIAVARGDGPPPESAGTLAFMAPELFRGGHVGRRTDVWGAASTAFDLRYGHAPFKSVGEIIDPEIPPRFPPPASPAEAYFQDVLRRMLDKDLARRPPDITAPLHHFTMLARALEPPVPKPTRLDGSTLLFGNIRLSFVVGDIATADANAIVNSANFQLTMRTGCGEALRRKGGDRIEEDATKDGEQPLGSCIATTAGELAAKHVFHAVSAWNEVSCVGRAFARALLLAEEHGCQSIAAPALGTGAGRVSLDMSANAMMTTLRWHAMLGGSRLRDVTIWLDSEAKRRTYQDIAEEDLGFTEMRQVGAVDVGLPVEDAQPSSKGATFLDPRKYSSD